MRLIVGGTPLDDYEVAVQISKSTTLGARGLPSVRNQVWNITGWILADSPADLDTKITAREALFDSFPVDLSLQRPDGTPVHVLSSTSSLDGTRVRRFQWLGGNPRIWGMGTELVQKRTYSVTVDASYLADGADQLVSYTETFRFLGTGGRRRILVGSLTGPMQEQIPQLFTELRLIQSGYAVGLTTYPSFPEVLYEGLLESEPHQKEISTPRNLSSRQQTHFPITWRYVYLSSGLLQGVPAYPV